MKKIVTLILAGLLCSLTYGQSFMNYKDTVNHFSINIPEGWTYGKMKEPSTIQLVAYRTPISKSDTSGFGININIIKSFSRDEDLLFSKLIAALSDADKFKLIDKGDTTMNGIRFRWLIETHGVGEIKERHYDFVTFKDGKTYILTMSSLSNYFDTVKSLFDKIAGSFIVQ